MTTPDERAAPFINHTATLPLVSRQMMSPNPSPLKSPTPAMDQVVGMLPTDAVDPTAAPFMNHIAVLPLVSCQRRSALPSPLKSR